MKTAIGERIALCPGYGTKERGIDVAPPLLRAEDPVLYRRVILPLEREHPTHGLLFPTTTMAFWPLTHTAPTLPQSLLLTLFQTK